MMHEYVSYYREGSPPEDINLLYRQEILDGVKSLLRILRTHIPENELLNHCVDLYYKRGMVTLAALIMDNFKENSHCGAEEPRQTDYPADTKLVHSDGSSAGLLGAIRGEKIFTAVSSDCPVSMVKAVIKARKLSAAGAKTKNKNSSVLIVIPMEKLSAGHRSISRNVSGARILYLLPNRL